MDQPIFFRRPGFCDRTICAFISILLFACCLAAELEWTTKTGKGFSPNAKARHQEFQFAAIIPQQQRGENRALDVFLGVFPTTLD
jgi:hypothetical protein